MGGGRVEGSRMGKCGGCEKGGHNQVDSLGDEV